MLSHAIQGEQIKSKWKSNRMLVEASGAYIKIVAC